MSGGKIDKIYGVVETSEYYAKGDYVDCIELNGYDKDIKRVRANQK